MNKTILFPHPLNYESPPPELEDEIKALMNASFLPDDYPTNISQDPQNVQVALGQVFADPALGEIIYDERQMRCNEDGGIYLAGKEDSDNGRDHVLNFLDSLKETYGVDVRNKLNIQHDISAWPSLTWGTFRDCHRSTYIKP